MEQWTFKICILGEGAVGKTSLINKFVYNTFDDKYLKTIGTKVSKKVLDFPDDDTKVSFTIFDILGQMASEELQASFVRGAQGALLVCDLTNHETFEKLENWISLLDKVAGSIPVVVLGNKCDLVDQIAVTKEELGILADRIGGVSFYTSAKTGENVEESFELLSRKLAGLSEGSVAQPESVDLPLPSEQQQEPLPAQSVPLQTVEQQPPVEIPSPPPPEQPARVIKEKPLISPELFSKIELPPRQKRKAEKQLHKFRKFMDQEVSAGRFTAEELETMIQKKEVELGLKPPPLRSAPPPPPDIQIPPPEIQETQPPPEIQETQPPPADEIPEPTPPPVEEVPLQEPIKVQPVKPTYQPEEPEPTDEQPEEPGPISDQTPPEPVPIDVQPEEQPVITDVQAGTPVRTNKISAFFNVPVEAIEQLRQRLEIILADREKEMVEGILTEYGFDCGNTAIKSMGITCDKSELEKTLPDLWIGIGLSKVNVIEIGDGAIRLDIFELEVDEPEFLGGCLAGVVSGLLGTKYRLKLKPNETGYNVLLEPGLSTKVATEAAPQPAPTDAPAGETEKYQVEHGISYIISDKALGFNALKEKTEHGWNGICLTREFPPRLREKYGLHKTPLFWLTDADSEDEQIVRPSRLSFELRREIMDFMKETNNGIILIHGLEYLISHLNFLEVLKWLQGLRDQAAITNTTLLVAVNPDSIDRQNYQNLILEFETLSTDE